MPKKQNAKARRPAKKRAKPKASKALIEQRVHDIARILLDGARPFEIRPYVSAQREAGEHPWKDGEPLSPRQIRRYVRAATKLIEADCRIKRTRALRQHLAKRKSLYARAVQVGDLGTALRVVDSLAKLELPPEPEELKVKIEQDHPKRTPEENAEMLAGFVRDYAANLTKHLDQPTIDRLKVIQLARAVKGMEEDPTLAPVMKCLDAAPTS